MHLNCSVTCISPERLINSFRRFGRFGPAYQILGIVRQLEDGDVMMKIHVCENNEDLEYLYSHILNDPEDA